MNKMVAHPLATSRIRAFIGTLVEWADTPWATTVDIPFVIDRVLRRGEIEHAIAPEQPAVWEPLEGPREEQRTSDGHRTERGERSTSSQSVPSVRGLVRRERSSKWQVDSTCRVVCCDVVFWSLLAVIQRGCIWA